jgi:hypothetical protein
MELKMKSIKELSDVELFCVYCDESLKLAKMIIAHHGTDLTQLKAVAKQVKQLDDEAKHRQVRAEFKRCTELNEGDIVADIDNPTVELEIVTVAPWGIEGQYKTTATDGFNRNINDLILIRRKREVK